MSDTSYARVDALLSPRNVVIVGASERPGSWAQIVWSNLERFGYPGPVYPVNPRYKTVWGVRCFADVEALPENPDHLVILTPAPAVSDVIIAAGRAGARSATVFSDGFAAGKGTDGAALRDGLIAALDESGLAISGPNCMGNIAAKARVATLADHRMRSIAPGPVAIVGQSGGILMAIQRRLADRAIGWGYLITSGNEIGLTTANYIAYLASDDDVRVILCFIESVKDVAAFLAACRTAHVAGKHVVAIKLGGSAGGRAAALAHTGSLAGAIEAFDAVTADAGVIRVDNLNDMIEVTEYLCRLPRPGGLGIGAITFSGGLKGMLIEAAERQGYGFPALGAAAAEGIETALGAGTVASNPLDAGFTGVTNQAAYLDAVEAMIRDPEVDVVMLQEELPREAGSTAKENNLRKLQQRAASGAPKPIVFFSMLSHDLTDYSRALRAELPDVAFLQEPETALRALRFVAPPPARPTVDRIAERGVRPEAQRLLEMRPEPGDDARALSELDSKSLLGAYGIAVPEEAVAASPDAAAAAAARIGFPVVMKAVSERLTHKSDVGGVLMGIDDEAGARAGFRRIVDNVSPHDADAGRNGVLVARQIAGGIELVVGIQNDPEMGPVVMFGGGGVSLELYKDVAFAAPPIDAAAASWLIERTKAGRLVRGYRGGAVHDEAALIEVLCAVGALAEEAGPAIDSLDINPLVVLEAGRGAVALDALVVLKPHG